MTRFVMRTAVLLCLCLMLSGCGGNVQTSPEATVETKAAVAAAVTEAAAPETETTVPETEPVSTEEEETAAAPETLEVPGIAGEDRSLPVMSLPEVPEGPCHFFDDAAFMGDSISYSLMVHHTKTKDFGNAVFLVRGSLGIHNTLNKQLAVSYKGQQMAPWNALAAAGVKKVFLLMGMNDIGYYTIDDTMEKWETFLGNVREKNPDITVYIQSLTPMWIPAEQSLLNNENIDLYNIRLREFAETNGCHYVDVAPYLKNADNGMAARYSGDLYVHMNEQGTAAWATVLKAYGWEQEKENSES